MKKYRSSRIRRLATVATIIGAPLCGISLYGAPLSDEDVQALVKKVNDLEQQVKILQRNRDVDQEDAADKAKTTPTVELGYNGLVVRSPDSNFVMTAHGYVQADYRNYFGQKTTPDEFLLRRVRPIVEGTVWKDWNYRLMLDLASGNVTGSTTNNVNILDDAYVNAHYLDQFQVQIGKYKSPVGLERLQSTADLMFVETGYATELTPNYDLGAEVHNDYFNTPIGYSIGIFDGAADNGSEDAETDEGKDIVGRLFASPFINTKFEPLRQLGFGVGSSIGTHTAGALTSYKTPGQQTFYAYNTSVLTPTGNQYRFDPQGYWFWGPFGIMGEWILSSQKFHDTLAGAPSVVRFNNVAWQVEGSYFLTGEENSFKSTSLKHVFPRHRLGFGEDGGWGAFEVVGRIQRMTMDDHSFTRYGGGSFVSSSGAAREATSWGVGLNWYFNPNVKLNLDYETTAYTGGTPMAVNTPERVILSRVQFMF